MESQPKRSSANVQRKIVLSTVFIDATNAVVPVGDENVVLRSQKEEGRYLDMTRPNFMALLTIKSVLTTAGSSKLTSSVFHQFARKNETNLHLFLFCLVPVSKAAQK